VPFRVDAQKSDRLPPRAPPLLSVRHSAISGTDPHKFELCRARHFDCGNGPLDATAKGGIDVGLRHAIGPLGELLRLLTHSGLRCIASWYDSFPTLGVLKLCCRAPSSPSHARNGVLTFRFHFAE